MLRYGLAVLALATMVGCSTSATVNPFASNDQGGEREQLAAYAATSNYPKDAQPTRGLEAAALVNRDHNTIRIFNFSDQPIQNANVWVNNSFVHKVATIPAHGAVTLNRNEFFDSTGRDLSTQNTTVANVQIAWPNDGKVYSVFGPAFE